MNTVYICIDIFSLIMLFGSLCLILRKAERSRASNAFAVCQVLLGFWVVSQIILIETYNLHQLKIAYAIGNLGICFIGVFWFIFAVLYSRKTVKKPILAVLMVFSLSNYIAVLTNDFHHLYYSEFELYNVAHGIMFFINRAITYVLMICGTCIVAKHNALSDKAAKWQTFLLSASVIVPLVCNALYFTGLTGSQYDLTPLGFSVSSLFTLIATWRFGLLNVNELAINELISGMDDGVLIYGASNLLSYSNSTALDILQCGVNDISKLPDFFDKLPAETASALKDENKFAEDQINGRYIKISEYSCYSASKEKLATAFLLSDTTHYHELASAERKLGVERERNRIAQEVHDTTGHTLTKISALVKLAKISLERNGPKNNNECAEYLNEAVDLTQSGIAELRMSIHQIKDTSADTGICESLEKICRTIKGISIELCIQGDEEDRDGFYIKTISDSVRELITNAIRYSKASRMDIILKFKDKLIELYVFDNGVGCDKIVEGSGLTGIVNRINSLKGTVQFASSSGNGFNAVIRLPRMSLKGTRNA